MESVEEFLNLGSGYSDAIGWTHVDKIDYGTNIVADILVGLPFLDDHFDFVLMNHVLQTFTYNEHETVLKEVRRVMKPGATLRILVPDLDKAINAYNKGKFDYFPIADDIEKDLSGKFARYLFWHGETRCAFTWHSLERLLERNGFDYCYVEQFGQCELDSRESESLIMECRK